MAYLHLAILASALAVGATFVGILIAGLSHKIVVYYDGMDLLWSLGAALFASMAGWMAVAANDPSNGNVDPAVPLVLAVGALPCLYFNFKNSIRHTQSVSLGILVGMFKLVFSFLAVGLLFDTAKKILSSQTARKQTAIAILIFGALIWMSVRLVNGKSVYAAKKWLIQE